MLQNCRSKIYANYRFLNGSGVTPIREKVKSVVGHLDGVQETEVKKIYGQHASSFLAQKLRP